MMLSLCPTPVKERRQLKCVVGAALTALEAKPGLKLISARRDKMGAAELREKIVERDLVG